MIPEWSLEEETARLHARFDKLKTEHGMGQAAFARTYAVPGGPSMVSQHIKNRRPINLEAATAYARGFGCALQDISPRLANEISIANGAGWFVSRSVSNTSPGPDIQGKVPLISWVQAGAWCQAEDPLLPGEAERWMDCPVAHSGHTFALRVRGDSMSAPHGNSRTYPEGCFIFVDPEKRSPTNGDRIIACLDGSHEVTFKVYKNEDGRQWLQPLNPSHEPIREDFTVLGTVLGKWEDG